MTRTILVTGTSYGLGAAVAAAIEARGDVVVSLSRTRPASATERWIQLDLADTAAIPGAVEAIAGDPVQPLDGVVLNAAVADKSVDQWSAEEVERHFAINALAPVTLWNALAGAGLIADPCNVVLMGSFLQNGNVRQPAYAMSKAALWSWMRSYTMSQPTHAPVSMNMIWPGRVETPANPRRALPEGDPNEFYSAERITREVLRFLDQEPGGPRGTVLDMGRS